MKEIRNMIDKWIYIKNKSGGYVRALVTKKILLNDIVEIRIQYHITSDNKILTSEE